MVKKWPFYVFKTNFRGQKSTSSKGKCTRYQKILRGCSIGCKCLLNFTCLTIILQLYSQEWNGNAAKMIGSDEGMLRECLDTGEYLEDNFAPET